MKPYYDYEENGTEKRYALLDNRVISYEVLKQLQADNKLDNYDLFKIYTIGREDKEDLMYYKDGEFYYIESRSTSFKMINIQLKGRTFEFISQGDGIYDNGVQKFIAKHSDKEFNELSDIDKISVITGKYFKDELNSILDGLKETLSDVVDILKEEKEKENANSKKD